MIRLRWLLSLMLAALAVVASPVHAQDYPNRPIRIVVPFAAGGAVDALARVVGNKLSEQLGQPVMIENKAGAGGNIAADTVAKAAPDGYTILLTTNGQAISPSLYRSLPYNTEKDLLPVTILIESPLVLVASPKFAATTLKEVIAAAKANPGGLSYGSTGIGNPLHLTMELLKAEAGIDIVNVPYRGDAPLSTALLAGEVQLAVVPIATARANIEANLLRAVALTSLKRSKALPNIPTVAEQGIAGFDMSSWQGFFMPAGTPRPIVERIAKETRKALESPDVHARLEGFVAEMVGNSPDEFAKSFKEDLARNAKIVQQAKIPLQ
jgi:tripartite-type tricarboxylate transporter receptor subunit TctC